MDTATFLRHVVTTPEGWFTLGYLEPETRDFKEEWFKWPQDMDNILSAIKLHSEKQSVYFTAHLFKEQKSTKNNVLPSRTIQADLDYAEVPKLLAPTVLVETSPGRHQGYWVLKEPLANGSLELLSKQLTYSIPDCDRGCWSIGHKMRVPGTFNYKYEESPEVKVLSSTLVTYPSLPISIKDTQELENDALQQWAPDAQLPDTAPVALLAKVKPQIPSKVYAQYNRQVPKGQRSEALWALIMSLLRAGLSNDEVFLLARDSANNKFKEQRYNSDKDLAAEIRRAVLKSSTTSASSIKEKIREIRKSAAAGTAQERKQLISYVVQEDMARRGSFMSTEAGEYFIREDTGRPIVLARNSDYLDSFIEDVYGLNATEQEQRYVVAGLQSSSKERGREGRIAYLSYYNEEANSILLHTGRKEVLSISEHGLSRLVNGQMGILFPWSNQSVPFEIKTGSSASKAVPFEDVFSDCFDNIMGLTSEEAIALLRSWFMFLFFRDSVISRPILALFGQPGAGKSTMFRRVYALLYGGRKALNSVTTSDDFDYAVATDPLVVFDNVDTWTNWLPDKLALSASTSDMVKRKLYTDSDTVVLKRQALLGLTAHNPKFRREDIVDRLLLLNLERLPAFRPETAILNKILVNRDAIWAGLIADLAAVLATPMPQEGDVPKFRINDFARVGLRIARALGYEAAFVSALKKNVKEQVDFNLEEESVLVDAIKSWVRKKPAEAAEFTNVGELWSKLIDYARDTEEFRRQFPRSLTLGRKLWSLQESLKSDFIIEFQVEGTSNKAWRFEANAKQERTSNP